MSIATYYTFFDAAVVDPIWERRWKDLIPRNAASRQQVADLIRFGFNSQNPGETCEPTAEELSKIFESKTIAWTIRRSTPQFFVMGELMGMLPKLMGKSLGIQGDYNEDCFALLAAGIHGWVQKQLTTPTLKAILKLHNFQHPELWLDLPTKLKRHVKKLISVKMLAKPLYRWQGPEACQYAPFGFTDYERHNGIRTADTQRFLDFIQQAWDEDWEVPYLKAEAGRGVSVGGDGQIPNFRQVDLAETLIGAMKRIRRFHRPCVFRVVS